MFEGPTRQHVRYFFGEKLAQYVTINHSQEFRAAEQKLAKMLTEFGPGYSVFHHTQLVS